MNYTGIFYEEGSREYHMTWKYGFPLEYPPGVKRGDTALLTILGMYQDEQVCCIVVEWAGETHQPGGTLLHVTLSADGASPVQSGIRATERGYRRYGTDHPSYGKTIEGVWK